MVENIKLFINDKEVEFTTEPDILFTYQVTDITNPTAVKNSFTKQVSIPGTPNNNDIFGHYWNLERYLMGGGEGGAFYNSSKKAPFQLFRGSTLYEEGYAKLDSIKQEGENIIYSLTLYGGLGDFFFQLSTTDSGDQKKLSDLTFMPSGGTDEFDFTMNIDTVNRAWGVLSGRLNPNFQVNKKWQYINFMPAYNGKPSDFDTDKVVLDISGTSIPYGAQNSSDNNWYYVKNRRWTLGLLPEEMSEWDMHDLRSYLQRPCIRMKEIINACCNPDNNGGYTVNLDTDFFDSKNPYWEKTWLTLPQVCDLEYSNSQQTMTGATLVLEDTTGSTTGLMYQDIHFDLGDFPSNLSKVNLNTKIYFSNGYSNSSFVWFWNYNGDSYHTGWWCLGSLFCQLIAVNGDTVVGASEVYNLTTPVRHNGKLWYGHNGHYPESTGYDTSTGTRKMGAGSQYVPYMDMPIYNVLGKFSSRNTTNAFSREISPGVFEDDAYTFRFNINNIAGPVTGLKMVFYWGATADKVKHFTTTTMFNNTYCDAWITLTYSAQGGGNADDTHMVASSVTHDLYAVVGESLGRTGTQVNKQLLLNTQSSPCDYLLSYCKMFGLHFEKVLGEKTINIMTRKTFYQRDNIVDLNEWIDRSKDISITPLTFSSKWYQFLQEKDETEMQKKYLTAKGVEYGCKVLDTGYEFATEKKDLLEKNCIKSGIEVLEKSKWFIAYNNDSKLRPWMKLGMKYKLWYQDQEMEYLPSSWGTTGAVLPLNEGDGLRYYDVFPKLQFHDDGGDPTDGNDCLVFFSGFKDVTTGRTNPLSYILSDDNVWQTELNEGNPCWLFTNSEYMGDKRCCYKLDEIPVFERYLTAKNSDKITKSLDFGSPQELYIPNYSLTDDTNIYYNFWRTYLTDLFNVNTKQLSCYVRITERPGTEWLRRFYWFDNAIWRVNKISDYNAASYDPTKVEFIKVQDVADYTSISQVKSKTIELSANTYTVPASGGTVTLKITVDDGGSWQLIKSGDANVGLPGVAPARTWVGGSGTSSLTVTFSANTGTTYAVEHFRAKRRDNAADAKIDIQQSYPGQQSVTAYPEDVVVGASGGSVVIDFTWFNQGGSYIDYEDHNEGSEYLQFTSDTDTYKYENKAVLTFSANTGTTVLHNYCTFRDSGGTVYCSIGIDQLPAGYSFNGGGETMNIPVEYATGGTFSNVPYWITVVNNLDHTYDLVADGNLYETGRIDYITLELDGSSAEFYVSQGVVNEFNVTRIDGSGNVLVTGGTIQLMVKSTTGWTGSSNVAWAVLSSSSGTTSATITVTFGENTGETRDAVFTFVNDLGQTVTYTQTQEGIQAQSLVQPNVLIFDATGGTSAVTVNIHNAWKVVANSPWVAVGPTSGSTADDVNITAQPYSGTEQRQGVVVFFDSATTKTYPVTVIQNPSSGEILAANPSRLTFPASGGTILLTIISNTDWTIA